MILRSLVSRLKVEEGTGPVKNGRHMPYRDSVGKTTIGYGRNLTDRGLSATEAEHLLMTDALDVLTDLSERLPFWRDLDDVRRVVLADMGFNMGAQKLISGWPNFLAAVARKDYTTAADTMLASKWRRQVKGRAVTLAAMMRNGVDVPA